MGGWLHRFAYNFTLRSIVKRARAVIAVSQHTKNDLLRLLKPDPQKISVIHEGVNPRFHHISDRRIVDEFRKKENLARPYLLYTGVWRSHKNLVNLIKAFAIFKHKGKFDGMLVITGKEDPWYPEVKQTVAQEHLEGDVRFTGLIPDEDLVVLYNGAAMYVLPSLYEGFGLPALEAMACGVPVCASETSSLPEVCGRENAVFFNPKNPSDMAEKISSLYNNKEKMQSLRERGQNRIKDFSWQRMAEETLELYKNSHVYPDSKNPSTGHQ